MVVLSVVLLSVLVLLGCTAKQQSQEDYYIQKQLVTSLSKNPYASFTLKELFFPRLGSLPVCAPIVYELSCNDTDFAYNTSLLWTSYDAQSYVGQILLASAYYGILVKGFDWETSCFTDTDSEIVLQLELAGCDNLTEQVDTLDKQLLAFTAVLKAYADSSGFPKGDSLLSYKAYALEWKEPEKENQIFHTSYIILSTMVGVLDFFIFVFSIGICSTVYDVIYGKIKGKKNPYYPLFIAVVLCSIVWNAGPGWLVLMFDTNHIRFSFIVLIPIQFTLALLMKKYPDFPIPGFACIKSDYTHLEELPHSKQKSSKGNNQDSFFFWEICRLRMKNKGYVIMSFIMQTIGVWSLLVLFTFVVFYGVGITISLYLYPIQTLVKIIFIKAVAVCIVFNVAILFSGNVFDFTWRKKGVVKNINDIAMLFATLSLLPVIGFVAFVAGGVIFSSSDSQLNGIQGVLALLPSAVLLLVGWYSKGTLFPEELVANEGSTSQTLNDVEAVASSDNDENDGATPKKSSVNHEKKYGSTDSHA